MSKELVPYRPLKTSKPPPEPKKTFWNVLPSSEKNNHETSASITLNDDNSDLKKDREIRHFLNTVAVAPKNQKMPDIIKYLSKNTKNTVVVTCKKKTACDHSRLIADHINERATRRKNDSTTRQVVGIDMPQINYHEKLFGFFDVEEPIPMQATQLENIVKKSKMIRTDERTDKNSDISKYRYSLIDEVKADYIKITKKIRLGGILKPVNIPSTENPSRKRVTKTLKEKMQTNPFFLESRRLLMKRLHMIHPDAVLILNFTKCEFLKNSFNIESYRFDESPQDLKDIMSILEQDIRDRHKHLVDEWYTKLIGKEFPIGYGRQIVICTRPSFLRYVSYLISLEMDNMILKSLSYIVNVFGDKLTTPKLKFKIYFEGAKCISTPSVKEICGQYYSIFKLIRTSINDLPSLENYFNVEGYNKTIAVNQSRQYLSETKYNLSVKLTVMFKELTQYLKKIERDFSGIMDKKLSETFSIYFRTNHTYAEILEMLVFLHGFKYKALKLVDFRTFELGSIDQVEIKNQICDLVENFMDITIECAVVQLLRDHETVDNKLNEIVTRAFTKPIDSEEFFALGKYMLYVSTTFMEEMTQTVKNLTIFASEISRFTALSKEFWHAHTVSTRWIQNIGSVLFKYSTVYEIGKSSAEDTLAKVIGTLNYELDTFEPNLTFLDNIDDIEKLYEYKILFNALQRKIDKFNDMVVWINKEQTLLNKQLSEFVELNEIKDFTRPFINLITFSYSWSLKKNVWMRGDFNALSLPEIEIMVDDFYKEASKMQKLLRIKCKEMVPQNSGRKYQGIVDDSDMNLWPAPLKIIHQTVQSIKEFRLYLPMIGIMCNPALTERHWEDMSELTGFDLTPNAGTTLEKMINLHLEPLLPQFDIISIGATKEEQLRNTLEKMKEDWKTIILTTSPYKDTKLNILSGLDEIQMVLDDHLIKTMSIRGSAFVKPIASDVKEWFNTVNRMNMTLDEWAKVQIQWLYLLPIFSSKDIVSQMPEEGSLFNEINTIIKSILSMVNSDPLAIKCIGQEGVLELLVKCTEMMETINVGVNSYLEKKRLFFTRFFFLSNDEMLEILSETKNPKRVQPHLKKCFEGIAKLEFDKNLNIMKLLSSDGEEITLNDTISTINAKGSVEKWLLQVEEQMVLSIRISIKNAHDEYPTINRTAWVQKWPGQSVLCVSQIYWTSEVEAVFDMQKPEQMRIYHTFLTNQLNDIVDLVRGKLNKQTRISLSALVTLDVHCRDVVDELAINNVSHSMDFKWLSQLRYYWEDDALVRITNATIKYAYEYLGNTPRLVITPLTDRCYRTLISAYHLHLNGAPEGPAGTGKTETTKDLAKALAVQCVVFNCSDSLDYLAMGKFFKGLASSGAWACFDEFNRIDIEVLSVIAQQILCIIQAVRSKLETFMFEGTELKLNPRCYVCITMNPGYAGRSELPDNLKALFRTVAMMVPDYAMIGEISLYSYGFVNARELSVKIVTTYKLCSEQLSSESHYDYGMRAVKTVLIAAGNLKMKYPKDDETELLLRSILDVNSAKFLNKDVPLFNGIISDLFPNVKLPNPNYNNLTNAAKVICVEMNLQPTDTFIEKLIQTYEMMVVRHGFMLVGNPFGGKTSLLHLLAKTLSLQNKLGQSEEKVEYETVNPKTLTMGQLYGCFDDVSREWSDGVVANTFRKFSMSDTSSRKWLIFDGPVDAIWIENMNTVLDDNKKLCLTSGEVIGMPDCMSMIFEVMDLNQASPATVSRCGMIYSDPKTLGWRPLIVSWMQTCPEFWSSGQNGIDIMCLFDWITPPCLYFIRRNCVQLTNAGETNTVLNVLNILEMQLKNSSVIKMKIANTIVKNPNYEEHFISYLQGSFIYASIWGFGGTLDSNSRPAFDLYFKELWKGKIPSLGPPEALSPLEVLIPTDGMLYDYIYYCTSTGSWKHMSEVVKDNKLQEMSNIGETLVHTLDTIRYMHLIEIFISHRKPLLLFGPTGTGKSFYIKNYMMNKLSLDQYVPSFVTFTIQISANLTQEIVLSKLIKRKRGIYGPPSGKVCVIFVDDMNMPVKEEYGAQPPIELLRQYFDHGHWYDLRDTSKIHLKDILLLSAIGPTGGSRQDVYARFLRHFGLFAINSFDDDSITNIYSTLLHIGLKRNGFTLEVIPIIDNIIQSTINLYRSAISNLAPTPAKSHYLFNLRDISKITNGILMFRKESFVNRRVFSRLWVHEVMRVFYDRLNDDKDREWLFEEIRTIVNSQFIENFNIIFKNLSDSSPIFYRDMSNLIFTNVLDLDVIEDKKYEEPPSLSSFKNIAQMVMDEYDMTHKSKLNIVLFNYALEHLSRICRILTIPGGCGLLIGIGGAGRQSLTRLAAAICNYNVFQPEITNSYGLVEWRDDLKTILKESGGKNRPTVFLFAEGQVKEEYFLQDIDALLNSGEVPNLFTFDEQQSILEMVRLAAQGGNRNLDISPLIVFNYFINRCKQNLHICLCFSPIGSALRNRLRLYPSMVSCCTIDWFEDWPENALEMVAHQYLKDVNLPEKIRNSAVTVCQRFHIDARKLSSEFYSTTRRRTYITSASYLDLIKAYIECTARKQKETMEFKMRYVGGLKELEYATEQVNQMKEDLFILKPKLQKAQIDTEEMMNMISHETLQVEKVTARVQEDEKIAKAQAESANKLKTECEADLASAKPAFEEAISALNTLKPTDIALIKAMKNPPKMVKFVMEAVCVMLGVLPDRIPNPRKPGHKMLDYWAPSTRILGDINFLQKLKDYDKNNISPQIMATIRKTYLSKLIPKEAATASSAAKGLCMWILALNKYDTVLKFVAPKEEKLEIANKEFEETMAVLEEKRKEVRELQDKLDSLNSSLEEAILKKENLFAEIALSESKLLKAEKLLGSLGGEKYRWAQRAQELQTEYECIPGDILISCGIIAYLAPFTANFRSSVINRWKSLCNHLKIPSSNNYSLINVLGVPIKIQNWNINGLPLDSFSIDNAIIMNGSQRWSLLIDPQSQAHKWIKTMEKSNDIVIVKLTDLNYMRMIEIAIEIGKPVLIENVLEDLDPPLDPLLFKQFYQQGKLMFIALGENVIEYNPSFRLYITSKLRNPHYLPEIFNKVTIINFALTVEGLEDQLLGIVVAKERPLLESKRQQLIEECAENDKALLDVENSILQMLSGPGNILEDEDAVDILDNSKILAMEITRKKTASIETVKDIDQSRMQYKPIATHCSILYYCITDLPNLDPMYQYSLSWYINIFIMTIRMANKSNNFRIRLEALKETFTYNLYANVCRSLFEKDKTLFSFIMCTTIMLTEKKIDKQELSFLATGGIGLKNTIPNPGSNWLPDKSWDEICLLNNMPAFNGIKDDFVIKLDDWRRYYDLTDHSDSKFPDPWFGKLSDFQRILVVRVVRPDKVIPVITKLIESVLGVKFTNPPPFSINRSYDDSNCLSPLIFILSAGTDPMTSLLQFADEMGQADSLQSVSLGQGQGPIAEALVQDAQKTGGWVCLQNCHLFTSWMGSLETICDSFDVSNVHSDFRLWLTSYPSDKFPVSVLQNGVKMTNEPPTGLQANMLRNYQSYPVKDQSFFKGCPGKSHVFAKLLYGITFFHAVVQERRNFGPIGWNIPYGFNESDYHISIQQLQMYINEFDEVPYEAVKYLTGECNYGGKVTDSWDRRAINTILDIFCCPQVVENPYYSFCDISPAYGIPYLTDYHIFVKQIEAIPAVPSSEVFGLHVNSGITRDLQRTWQLFDSFVAVVETSGGADDSDTTNSLLTAIASDILAKLPDNFDVETATAKYPVMYTESMNTVLVQEMERFNVLLSVIRKSLQDLIKAIKGAIVMTPELETMATSLSLAKFPMTWLKFSYPSLNSLGGYITNFIERLNFLQVWYDNGKPDNFWISGFFFTQAFLTGAMQNFARRYAIPIDQLCFDFQLQHLDRIDAPPEDGVYCYGLFLDGARWDRFKMILEEQLPKVLTDVLPLVWFIPIRKNDLSLGNRYTCPVYKTSDRRGILSTTGHSTNYVLPIFLDTTKKASHWIYRGTALLCQLNV